MSQSAPRRRCRQCGRLQTSDPTFFDRKTAKSLKFCLCWYDALDRIREEYSRLEGALDTLLEEIAIPVHELCSADTCTICRRYDAKAH